MAEVSTLKKNKINLEDYNYKQDIENRLLMAQFTSNDIEILEEILYSSIKIPIRKLAKSVDLSEGEVFEILKKLSKTGLFSFEEDSIAVDKEMRKYFESQMQKFEPEFKPGMDYLQSLLRKVPIHILPIWYSIPRTSNNIFDSLVEKYLLTPQIFHRHIMELNFNDPVLTGIVEDVYKAPEYKLYGTEIMEKHKISREQFEECMLQLEFHFVCTLGYEKVGNDWTEVVSPLHEWCEYASFLASTETPSIPTPQKVVRLRPQDFSFIQDLGVILNMAKKQPIALNAEKVPASTAPIAAKLQGFGENDPALPAYLERLVLKLRQLKLADIVDSRLYALESANDYLDMGPENRANFLHRHPLNRLVSKDIPAELVTDRNLREAEKSISRVAGKGWVYFDEFVRGVIAPLGEHSLVMLKRQGKTWKYSLPSYSEEELALIKATVLEWLFEIGVTAVGTYQGKACFCVTPFGQDLFGQ